MVALERVEGPLREQSLDLGPEGIGELLTATAGVAEQGAAVEQVLRHRLALLGSQLEGLVAADVQARNLALFAGLVQGHQLVDVHLLPAVPEADGGADVAHQVIDVAGVGVPVLGGAIFELGDHQGRSRLGLGLATS